MVYWNLISSRLLGGQEWTYLPAILLQRDINNGEKFDDFSVTKQSLGF